MKSGKMIRPRLAGQTVTMMEIIYETKDRGPFKINRMYSLNPHLMRKVFVILPMNQFLRKLTLNYNIYFLDF